MATLIRDDVEIELEDNSQIIDAAEELGVLFGCKNGRCCTCMIRVLEGEDNLHEMNNAEKLIGLPDGCRLACQARIKSGEVLIE